MNFWFNWSSDATFLIAFDFRTPLDPLQFPLPQRYRNSRKLVDKRVPFVCSVRGGSSHVYWSHLHITVDSLSLKIYKCNLSHAFYSFISWSSWRMQPKIGCIPILTIKSQVTNVWGHKIVLWVNGISFILNSLLKTTRKINKLLTQNLVLGYLWVYNHMLCYPQAIPLTDNMACCPVYFSRQFLPQIWWTDWDRNSIPAIR